MKYIFFILFSLSISIFAQENENSMELLLSEFIQKSDLSKNTKLSNAGHSIIFTRDKIEKMQARNLRDIVKTLPFFSYLESRYAVPNLYNLGDMIPFSSSPIRIYIDEHEMTNGLYGSSYAMLGTLELEFVDHIEVYYYTPSFEYSVESTFLLIKLYTKVPQREKGGKLLLSSGSFDFNQQSLYYSDIKNDISYFAYISNYYDKRDNTFIKNQNIKKDGHRKYFLGTISNENNHVLIDAQYFSQDAFANMSSDATPIDSKIDYENYQISYLNKSFKDIKIKASYQKAYDGMLFSEEINSPFFCTSYIPFPSGCINKFEMRYEEDVISGEISYSKKSKNNSFFTGANLRNKNITFTKLQQNSQDIVPSGFDTQNIYSIFAQNEYMINDNSVITAGIKHSKVTNNGGFDDFSLNLYRIGYVHDFDNITAKIFYFRTPHLIEPYLYSAWLSKNKNLSPQTSDILQSQLEYEDNNHYGSIVYGKQKTKNLLYYNSAYSLGPSVDNYDESFYTDFINLDYSYKYNSQNSISFNYFINFIKNAPSLNDYRQIGGFVRFLNSYKEFDFFNEIVYRKDSIENRNFYDYSSGVKYKYNNNMTFSFKAENLLNKGIKQKFYDFSTKQQTIESTPIDKRIYLTMEYIF